MIIIVGKTCSGKSSVANMLEKRYGIKRIRTYTSRPRRDGESEDEYNFITEEEFEDLRVKGFFFETTSYNVAGSDRPWKYGSPKNEILKFQEYENVYERMRFCIVMNPEGLKKLVNLTKQEPFFENITIFYLNISEGAQWERLRKRGDSSDEAQRRIKTDNEDFKDIENYYTFSASTENCDVEKIANWIINTCYINNGIFPILNK